MDLRAVNTAILIIGLCLLIGLPIYFRKKNARNAAKEEFKAWWDDMVAVDKYYAPYMRELNKNLNIINYWLKTGKDPTESEEEAEKQEQADRFFDGLMTPLEAKKWKESVKNSDDEVDFDMKSIRVENFEAVDMDPMDVNQSKMTFKYCTDSGEYIYYCATPQFLEKQMYRLCVFFTTARTTNLPLVYPYKYEGAQMLSLYKHPGQTVWFLKNWKLIREGLEENYEDRQVELDESIKDFDL